MHTIGALRSVGYLEALTAAVFGAAFAITYVMLRGAMTFRAGGMAPRFHGLSASALVVFIAGTAAARTTQLPLFAFPSSAASSEWLAVNDGVMGGVSDGRLRITDRQTLEFKGTLSLENNGGFASVRSRPRALGLKPGDTLVARVRGDGREYQLNLYTPSRRMAFSYRAPFPTRKRDWTEVRIPLDRFEATSFGRVIPGAGPVDPGRVSSVGFLLADGVPGPFLLEVAWIRVLRGLAR